MKSAVSMLAVLVATSLAQAGLVAPVSYAMPNGNGTASGGGLNYWDRNYTGTGFTTVDSAPLSGGLGDLTDGVITTQTWNAVENAAGTGPYVGWLTVDPAIQFTFSVPVELSLVRVHVDDSNGTGGVYLPSLITVTSGTGQWSLIPTDDSAIEPTWLDIPITGFTPSTDVTVTLTRRIPGTWIFADEVQFIAIPEPGCLGLIAPVAAMLVRRRRA